MFLLWIWKYRDLTFTSIFGNYDNNYQIFGIPVFPNTDNTRLQYLTITVNYRYFHYYTYYYFNYPWGEYLWSYRCIIVCGASPSLHPTPIRCSARSMSMFPPAPQHTTLITKLILILNLKFVDRSVIGRTGWLSLLTAVDPKTLSRLFFFSIIIKKYH